jgi:hypothetical protein
MRKIVASCLLLCVGSGASAGTPLWQKVEYGMSAAELHAAYPEEKGKVKHGRSTTTFKNAVSVGSCDVDAVAHHEKGTVEKVTVSNIFCDDAAYTALVSKYGKPLSDKNSEDDSMLAGDGDKTRRSIWVKDGVTVTMKNDDAGIWTITYRVLDKTGL